MMRKSGVGIGHAGRVGIFRNAPDPLDRGIGGDEALDRIHVRPVVAHLDRDHADAEALADGEMPVIARHRAKELYVRLVLPRAIAARQAEQHGAGHRVVHQVET